MKTMIATAAVLFALAGAASAGQCPSLWAKAEEAMKTATLDDATEAQRLHAEIVSPLTTAGRARNASSTRVTFGKFSMLTSSPAS